MKLTDKIYGLLYRNHRYGEGEYILQIYESEAVRRAAIGDWQDKSDIEMLIFEIALESLPLVKLRGG